jgi:CHAD domain-containing protein
VHRARVASRRLREVLPVLAAAAAPLRVGRVQRTLRKLTRSLGPVREMDVALGLLSMPALAARSSPAIELVRARLAATRAERRAAMASNVAALDLDKANVRLREIAVAAGATSDRGRWHRVLAARLARRAATLRRAAGSAGALFDPEALHRVRIATKKLRYAVEVADDTGAASATAQVRLLRREQDALGRLHDLQVLREHVRAAAAKNVRQAPALDVLARAIDDECRVLHARYLKGAPRLREVCEFVERQIVPALRTSAVGAARPRPIGMTLHERRRGRSASSIG